MRPGGQWTRVIAVAAAAVALALAIQSPVGADCGGPGAPRQLEDVLGTAFVGVFEGKQREPANGGAMHPFYHWTVDQTIAGPTLPTAFKFDGYSCNATSFTVGVEYLVSYNSGPPWGGSISTFNTVAYELPGDGAAVLVGFDVPAHHYPDVFQVTTLTEATALLGDQLPPTDAVGLGTEATELPLFGWLLAFGSGALWFARQWKRKRGSAELSS